MTARLDVAFGSVGKEALIRDMRDVRTEGVRTEQDLSKEAKAAATSYAAWWKRSLAEVDRANAESANLLKAMWQGREARAREVAQAELVQSNARLARWQQETAEHARNVRQQAQEAEAAAVAVVAAQKRAAEVVADAQRRAVEAAREAERERTNIARIESERRRAFENASAAIVSSAQRQATEAMRSAEQERTAIAKAENDKRVATRIAAESIVTAAQARAAAEREAIAKRAQAVEQAQSQTAADVLARARANAARQNQGVAAGGGSVAPAGNALFNWAVYTTGINQAIMLTQRLFYITSDLVNQAALWERYAVAIQTMEGSAFATTRALDDLYQIAKAPGIDLEGANKYYLQLRAVGVEGERAKEIITQFANTVARSGGGGVEFERVNRQLTQMLANGRVLESELKWMKESMPELAKLMQATFGTTTAKGIRDAGISADEFVTRLTAAMAEMPRAQETLQTSIENAATAWSMFKASMVDTDLVKASLRGITSLMENIVEGRKAAKIGEKMQETGASTMYISGYTKRAKESGLTDGEVLAAFQATGSEAAQAQSFMAYQRVKDAPKPKSQEEIDAAEEADKKAKDNAKRAAEQAERRRQEIQEMLAQQRVDAYNAEQANLVARRADKPGSVQRGASGMRWSDERMREDKAAEAKAEKEKKEAEDLRIRMEQQALDRMSIRLAERDALDEMRMTEHEKALAALHEEQRLILSVTEYGTQEREKLMAEHYKRLDAMERKHATENANVLLNGTSSLFGSLAEMRAEAMGKQNDMYKKLFTLEKSFAIASASLNLSKALMDALAQGGTVWEKMAAYGTVAAMGGQLISNITSMAYSGVYDKGGDIPMGKWGIAGENGPEIIQGPAHVTSTKDTAKLLGGAGGGTNVVINNYSSAQVTEKTRPDGSIELLIQEVAAAAEDRISAGIASGSSRVATVMQSVYGVRR